MNYRRLFLTIPIVSVGIIGIQTIVSNYGSLLGNLEVTHSDPITDIGLPIGKNIDDEKDNLLKKSPLKEVTNNNSVISDIKNYYLVSSDTNLNDIRSVNRPNCGVYLQSFNTPKSVDRYMIEINELTSECMGYYQQIRNYIPQEYLVTLSSDNTQQLKTIIKRGKEINGGILTEFVLEDNPEIKGDIFVARDTHGIFFTFEKIN